MELNLSSWQSFSDICITKKNLNCQYADIERAYRLLGPDANAITWVYDMPKKLADGTDNPEVALFLVAEPAFNWAVGQRPYPASTSDFMADDDSFHGIFTKSPDGNPLVSEVYYKFDHTTYVSGGEFWTSGAKRGDSVICDLVDKDGVIPMPNAVADAYQVPHGTPFPAGTVLSSYIRSRRLCPTDNQIMEFERPYWAKPPVGIYLRVQGVILNTVSDVTFDCNLFLHKPI